MADGEHRLAVLDEGAEGVEEKQVTLELARRLRGLIDNRLGIRVVLTRDEDRAVSLDERWQLEKWGSDAEAEAALETRRQDFLAAARFLALLG